MKYQKQILNLIQDVATPHNNVLISEFLKREDIELKLWYSLGNKNKIYNWEYDITNEYKKANIYGSKLNFKFLLNCILHRNEKYMIVGWANINTKLLHLFFFLFRQEFNHWTDMPSDDRKNLCITKKILRSIAYWVLRNSRAKVFAVGKTSIDSLKKLKFSNKKLINLPIFIEVEDNLSHFITKGKYIIDRYNFKKNDFIISCGSRLEHEKGYDILINAISIIPKYILNNLKLIIVGNGKSTSELIELINQNGLNSHIFIEPWLKIDDFKALISVSDIFIHPARFDSYGGTILGMSMGKPVIGSMGAGAAVDRIINGHNGFLYETDDYITLSNNIIYLYNNPSVKKEMGNNAHTTSLKWHPSIGIKIIIENYI
jgi:glycosyltransferase involved in cell wall biosynthesis